MYPYPGQIFPQQYLYQMPVGAVAPVPMPDESAVTLSNEKSYMPLWNENDAKFGIDPFLFNMITTNSYFKRDLLKLTTWGAVIDEIYEKVDHLDPIVTRHENLPSRAYCCLLRLCQVRLTKNQMKLTLKHKDSPFIRAIGLMYLRYTCPPKDMLTWFQRLFGDKEEFQPFTQGGKTTIGEFARSLFQSLRFHDRTQLPRIPVAIQKEIDKVLATFPDSNAPAPAEEELVASATRQPVQAQSASPAATDSREQVRDKKLERDRDVDRETRDSRHHDDRGRRDASHERDRDRDRYRDRDRDRDRDRVRDRDGDRDRDRDRGGDYDRRHGDRDRDRDRGYERDRRDRDRDSGSGSGRRDSDRGSVQERRERDVESRQPPPTAPGPAKPAVAPAPDAAAKARLEQMRAMYGDASAKSAANQSSRLGRVDSRAEEHLSISSGGLSKYRAMMAQQYSED
eukprot:TRINITY_DN11252_c0_g1_i1.p1 TRINITY_DN11252_c0_g1~~TRINITY_DN11252_c0_g1_i1.p1  ORF type:complete len:453 (+),score=44.71 TRINITY_DN11252_c0_g1_i1:34-1392(+)